MKRAQVEIMGLAMVIILLSLGMLFVVKFVVQKEPSTIKQDYAQSKIASNLMNAVLQSTTDCKKLTITELLQDCMTFESIDCDDDGTEDSCDFVVNALNYTFNNTLSRLRKNYRFNITATNGNTYATANETYAVNCEENRETELYPIPLHPGTMFVRLEICG